VYSRLLASLVACLAFADAARTAAANPNWMREFVCDFARDDAASRTPVSPLNDPDQDEVRRFGSCSKMVGNKEFTRLETHAWVAFTFDDGPSYKTTPDVIATLEKYDVPATFFVAGWRLDGKHKKLVQRNSAVLREAVRRGFHVGNHTHRHKNLRALSEKGFEQEIERSAHAIANVTGVWPHLMRPPYGKSSDKIRAYLDQEGYSEVQWSIDSDDYLIKRPEVLRKRTLREIVKKKGGVVLFHDTKPKTAAALPGILDDLEALNCRRLARGELLLLPVSLHYFAREKNGKPRPVPPEVAARTERYRERLPARCRARIDKTKPNN